MKRTILVVICALFVFPQLVQAKSADSIKGGFGFLYPDFNNQTNAGQLANNSGSAFEIGYQTQTVSGTSVQGLIPSLVYSNKRVGFGVYGSRVGTGFGSDESTDTVGGSLGFGLGKKGKFNVGFNYETSLEATTTDSGKVMGTLNMNPGKGSGLAVGLGVGTVLGSDTESDITGKVAVGYSGKNRNNNIEVVYTLPNVDSMDDYTLGVYGSLGDKTYYVGAGYEMTSASGADTSDLLGRVGLVLSGGRSTGFDVSATVRYPLDGAEEATFGGTARMSF